MSIYNGKRYDIPMDTWEALLRATREWKRLMQEKPTEEKEGAA